MAFYVIFPACNKTFIMTKKIIGFTIVFLYTSIIVSAQTRTDYVELIAADTIQLRAVSLEYTLVLSDHI
jgi:hypothetical protein